MYLFLNRGHVSISLMKFTGKVIKGDSRGREIGFPTLNLNTDLDLISTLSDGVYVVVVSIPAKNDGSILPENKIDSERPMNALMHFGPIPTFDKTEKRIEIHILDFEGDLYGREVNVEVFDKIRDITKFATKELLIEAIQSDVAFAKKYFK